jgi:protein-ribulosamine 3-kinase
MARLPDAVKQGVEAALSSRDREVRVRTVEPVAGGCVNHGARVDASDQRSYFLKWSAAAPPDLFEAEADGLDALGATGLLRVPLPIAHGGSIEGPAWLLMEYIPRGSADPLFGVRLGQALARIHASTAEGDRYGWHRDNWIGSLAQSNPWTRSWTKLWSEARLAPQLRLARERGHLPGEGGRSVEVLMDLLPHALDDVGDAPHLLHGDLWSGNVYPGTDGMPVLIDPAVYLGHGEVDLAMSELFGGLDARFYRAYEEAVGLGPAYQAYRRDVYQLYYLLVHVNLFGGGYEAAATRAARRAVSALRG